MPRRLASSVTFPLKLLVAMSLAGLLVVSCSSSSEEGCKPVGGPLLETLGIERASFVKSSDKLGNGRTAFYVGAPGGALWVSTADPAKDEAGIVLPLNDEARAASEAGVDTDPTAPIYGSTSLTSETAAKVKACAAG